MEVLFAFLRPEPQRISDDVFLVSVQLKFFRSTDFRKGANQKTFQMMFLFFSDDLKYFQII